MYTYMYMYVYHGIHSRLREYHTLDCDFVRKLIITKKEQKSYHMTLSLNHHPRFWEYRSFFYKILRFKFQRVDTKNSELKAVQLANGSPSFTQSCKMQVNLKLFWLILSVIKNTLYFAI